MPRRSILVVIKTGERANSVVKEHCLDRRYTNLVGCARCGTQCGARTRFIPAIAGPSFIHNSVIDRYGPVIADDYRVSSIRESDGAVRLQTREKGVQSIGVYCVVQRREAGDLRPRNRRHRMQHRVTNRLISVDVALDER